MKRVFFLCLVVFGIVFAGCHSDDDTWGDWSKAEPFGGVPRAGAVCFKIGDVVYAGLGYDTDAKLLKDFWKRTPDGSWKQIANEFIGDARYGASAFVLDGKAYVGLGFRPEQAGDVVKKYYNDFYEFDPATELWVAVESCPCTPRRDAVAFTLGDNGYVGCGAEEKDKVTNDFYAFNKSSKTWTPIGTAGEKRRGGTAFVIGDAAYICLGYISGSALAVDMMKFDGQKWTALNKLADISDDGFDDDYAQIPRAYAISFVSSLSGKPKGYIATGTNGSNTRTCWEFDPSEDRWDEMTPLPARASGRVQAIGYVVDDFGYFSLGGSSLDLPAYDDTWKFDPRIEEDDKNDY